MDIKGAWIQQYKIESLIYSCDEIEYFKVPNGFVCSVCGRFEWNKEPYCHCGAKMEEKYDS